MIYDYLPLMVYRSQQAQHADPDYESPYDRHTRHIKGWSEDIKLHTAALQAIKNGRGANSKSEARLEQNCINDACSYIRAAKKERDGVNYKEPPKKDPYKRNKDP
jgi:hypothetical protein